MTLRYSNQFRVLCAEEETEADRLEAVSARVRSWLGGRRDLPLAAAEPGRPPQRFDDGEGTTVTERRWADDQAERVAWAWAHPDAYDHDLRWRTEVDLARWDDRVTFSLIIRTESHSRALRPESIRLGCPRIVRDLAAAYPLEVRGWGLGAGRVEAGDVEGFVHSELLNPDRPLPVVLTTPDPHAERPLVSGEALQFQLHGLAIVRELTTKWAGFRLTDELGPGLTCFHGAVRIYWPGLTLDDWPLRHERYLGEEIKRRGQEASVQRVFQRLARESGSRHREGSTLQRVTRRFEEADARERQKQHEALPTPAELERLENRNLELEIAALEAAETIARLQDDLDNERENWSRFAQEQIEAETQAGTKQADDNEPAAFPDVASALAQAETDFPDELVVLPSAHRSAADSPFLRPEEVYRTLEKLAELCMEWSENRGVLGSDFALVAKQRYDLVYKPAISEATRNRWGKEYTFKYGGNDVLFEEHITLGSKQANTCLSIHLHRDADAWKLVIGHCGRHLRNTLT